MQAIYDLTIEELENYFEAKNEKIYKAKYLYNFLYKEKIKDFDEITTLKKALREELKKDFYFPSLKKLKHEKETDVEKFLFVLEDDLLIEAVLMRHDYGLSLCMSSQVGCNMGCKFCESGRLKKRRNLAAYEMVEQILKVEELIGEKITRIVVMGIGEPFDNYDNFTKFVKIINSYLGLSIGSRHITVSTCGIVPKIKEFADFPYQVNLAISLHSAIEEKRKEMMPIANAYDLKALKDSLIYYFNNTHRRITIEYIMLNKINDSLTDAKALVEYVKDLNCYINLIPYNSTNASDFKRSSDEDIKKFYDYLIKNNLTATVRKEFGSKISAACGQLSSMAEK